MSDFDVVIAGGGAAGVLAAIHLLARPGLRVAIVEPRDALARGVAYSTTQPEHLLNVVAARMSAFDTRPDDFVEYLLDLPDAPDRARVERTFAQRRVYGRYLGERLQQQPGVDGLVHVRATVTGLDRGARVTVRLDSGDLLQATHVLLAAGNAGRALPLPGAAIEGAPRIIEAWEYDAVRAIDADRDVCIIGSGLSMVDAALTLAGNGHRGAIDVISRHGLAPLGHVRPGSEALDVNGLLGLGVRERVHALRQHVAVSQAAGRPWQWTMDALRPHGRALWTSLDAREQRRFLRHAARFWDIHRHRIAPEAAAQLERLRARGQWRVHAGRLLALSGSAHAVSIRYRPRHAQATDELHAGCVINATGVETAIDRQRGSLYARLRAEGLVQPGPHGLGIAAGARGEVLDAHRVPVPGLHTLGASRIGEQWESIAVPELRTQAAEIAAAVQADVAASRPA